MSREQDLAYGRYYGGNGNEESGERGLGDSARGFLTDGLKKLKDQYSTNSTTSQQGYYSSGSGAGQQQGSQQPYQSSSSNNPQYQNQGQNQNQYQYQNQNQNPNPNQNRPQKLGLSSFLDRFEETVSGVGTQLAQRIGTTIDADAYAGYGSNNNANKNRFNSFAPARGNNDVKWHVDGFTYFWAVSRALETARESIWILDCKLIIKASRLNICLHITNYSK
jgi:phospholipase D1/2